MQIERLQKQMAKQVLSSTGTSAPVPTTNVNTINQPIDKQTAKQAAMLHASGGDVKVRAPVVQPGKCTIPDCTAKRCKGRIVCKQHFSDALWHCDLCQRRGIELSQIPEFGTDEQRRIYKAYPKQLCETPMAKLFFELGKQPDELQWFLGNFYKGHPASIVMYDDGEYGYVCANHKACGKAVALEQAKAEKAAREAKKAEEEAERIAREKADWDKAEAEAVPGASLTHTKVAGNDAIPTDPNSFDILGDQPN